MARNIQQNAVTASTSAVQLVEGNPNRTLLTFTNNGSVTVYLGGASVSTSAFVYPLDAGDLVQFAVGDGDVSPLMTWYGVTGSSTASVSVGEVFR